MTLKDTQVLLSLPVRWLPVNYSVERFKDLNRSLDTLLQITACEGRIHDFIALFNSDMFPEYHHFLYTLGGKGPRKAFGLYGCEM